MAFYVNMCVLFVYVCVIQPEIMKISLQTLSCFSIAVIIHSDQGHLQEKKFI